MTNPPLRFGILGAARIAPMALVRPAREGTGVEVVAVAARDERRARAFARRHRIPRTHGSYAALLADPEVDAVYVPLPNSLHAEWTIRALEAGKHVLCEKPLASNAAEAALVIEAAQRSGRLLIEAFHWRHHPLAARMREIVTSGELGAERLETGGGEAVEGRVPKAPAGEHHPRLPAQVASLALRHPHRHLVGHGALAPCRSRRRRAAPPSTRVSIDPHLRATAVR